MVLLLRSQIKHIRLLLELVALLLLIILLVVEQIRLSLIAQHLLALPQQVVGVEHTVIIQVLLPEAMGDQVVEAEQAQALPRVEPA